METGPANEPDPAPRTPSDPLAVGDCSSAPGSQTPNAETRDHVVLVGLMATGKTTIGSMIAAQLDRPFFDSDDQVEERTGRTVREIWKTDGEETFRRLEAEALAAGLDADAPSVIAGAGGVVLAEANRQRLHAADAFVVWLRARPGTLLDRIDKSASPGDGGHRPLLDDDPAGMLEAMARDRNPLYDDVSDFVVDVDDRSPRSVAGAVVSAVKERDQR